MPAAKKSTKAGSGKSASAGVRFDIVLGGPMLIVPAASDGNVTEIEVFSPQNGHPVGAVFVPGVWFTDKELNDPKCERWPEPQSFSLLDSHSYSVELTQAKKKPLPPFAMSAIPDSNHKVKPGRRVSPNWEIAIALRGQVSAWSSQRVFRATEDLYVGADAPTSGTVAGMHRLTYEAVTGAEFHGAARQPREYLRANVSQGGSLIILGEIPYQASLAHERRAIDALARLAGLDLHLVATDPEPHKSRLMSHIHDCGHSVILA